MRSTGASVSAPRKMAPTQRVAGLVALPQLIRQLGGDAEALIVGAGLEPSALSHPDNRVSFTALATLLDRAASSTGCAHFGLLAGRLFHLSDMGLVGELV